MMEALLSSTKAADRIIDQSQIHNELIFRKNLSSLEHHSFQNMMKFIADLSLSYKNVLTYMLNFKMLIDDNFYKTDSFFELFTKLILHKFQEPIKMLHQHDIEVEFGALSYKMKEYQFFIQNLQKLVEFISAQIPDDFKTKAGSKNKELINDFTLWKLNALLNSYLQRVQESLDSMIDNQRLNPSITENELKEARSNHYKHLDEHSSLIEKQMNFLSQVEEERYRFLESLIAFCNDMKACADEKLKLLKRVQFQFKACIEKRKIFCIDLDYLMSRDPKLFLINSTTSPTIEGTISDGIGSISHKETKNGESNLQKSTDLLLPERPKGSASGTRPMTHRDRSPNTARQIKSARRRSIDKKEDTLEVENSEKILENPMRKPPARKMRVVGRVDNTNLRINEPRHPSPLSTKTKTARSGSNGGDTSPLRDAKDYKIRTIQAPDVTKSNTIDSIVVQKALPRSVSPTPQTNSIQKSMRFDTNDSDPGNPFSWHPKEQARGTDSDLVSLQRKVRELVQTKLSSMNTRVKELANLDPDKIERFDSIHQTSKELLGLNENFRKLIEEVGEEITKCAEFEQIAANIEREVIPKLEEFQKNNEKITGSFYHSSAELIRALPNSIQRVDQLLGAIGKNSASEKLKPYLTEAFEFYLKLKIRLVKSHDNLRAKLFQAKQYILQCYQQDFKKFALLNKEYTKFLQNAYNGEKYFEIENSQKLISSNAEYQVKIHALSDILSMYQSDHFEFEIPKLQQCMELMQKLLNSSGKLDMAMQIMMEINNKFLTYDYDNMTSFRLTEHSKPLKQFLEKKYYELDEEIINSYSLHEDVRKIMKQIASVMKNINLFLSHVMAFESTLNEVFSSHIEKIGSTMKQELETAQYTATMLQSSVEKLSIDFLTDNFKNQPDKVHPIFRLLNKVISTAFDGDHVVLTQLTSDFNLVNVCYSLWNRSYKKFNQLDKFLQGLSVAQDAQDELYRSVSIIQSHSTNFLPNYNEKYLRPAFKEKVFVLMQEKIQQVVDSLKFLQKLFNYNESFSQKAVMSQISNFSHLQNAYTFFTEQWQTCKAEDPDFHVEDDVRRLLKETNEYIELFLLTVQGINEDYIELKTRISHFATMHDIKDEVKQAYLEMNNFLAYCKNRITKLALSCDSHFSAVLKKCVYDHNEQLMDRLLSLEKDFGRYLDIEYKLNHSLKGARRGDPEVQELVIVSHDIILNFEENYLKVSLLNEAFAEKAHIMMEKLLNYLLDYTKSETVWALKIANVYSITAKDLKRFRYLRNLALLLVKEINSGHFEKLALKVKSKALFQMYAEFLFLLDKVSMLTNKYLGPVLEATNLEFRKRLGKLKEYVLELVVTIKGNIPMKEKRKKFSELLFYILQECRQGPDSGDIEPLFLAMATKFQEFFDIFDHILSQEGKSEGESNEINGYIANILRNDIYHGDLKNIIHYQNLLTTMMNQFEQSNFAEISLAWLEIFYHTHLLIDWCEDINQHGDSKKGASTKDLKNCLQEAQKTIDRVSIWEKHQEIQDNIELFERRKKILVSIKNVLESYCKLLELNDELQTLPTLCKHEKRIENTIHSIDAEFKEVLNLIDFLDKIALCPGHSFRETFYYMKQKHETIRQLFYHKRVGFAEKNSVERSLFLLQQSIDYLLHQVILCFKGQKNLMYSHLLTQIFSERNTHFTLRVVKIWETDYSKFVIHAWAEFNLPQISREITIWLSPIEMKIQDGFKDPFKVQDDVVRDPNARFLLSKEYVFTWNVYGSQIEAYKKISHQKQRELQKRMQIPEINFQQEELTEKKLLTKFLVENNIEFEYCPHSKKYLQAKVRIKHIPSNTPSKRSSFYLSIKGSTPHKAGLSGSFLTQIFSSRSPQYSARQNELNQSLELNNKVVTPVKASNISHNNGTDLNSTKKRIKPPSPEFFDRLAQPHSKSFIQRDGSPQETSRSNSSEKFSPQRRENSSARFGKEKSSHKKRNGIVSSTRETLFTHESGGARLLAGSTFGIEATNEYNSKQSFSIGLKGKENKEDGGVNLCNENTPLNTIHNTEESRELSQSPGRYSQQENEIKVSERSKRNTSRSDLSLEEENEFVKRKALKQLNVHFEDSQQGVLLNQDLQMLDVKKAQSYTDKENNYGMSSSHKDISDFEDSLDSVPTKRSTQGTHTPESYRISGSRAGYSQKSTSRSKIYQDSQREEALDEKHGNSTTSLDSSKPSRIKSRLSTNYKDIMENFSKLEADFARKYREIVPHHSSTHNSTRRSISPLNLSAKRINQNSYDIFHRKSPNNKAAIGSQGANGYGSVMRLRINEYSKNVSPNKYVNREAATIVEKNAQNSLLGKCETLSTKDLSLYYSLLIETAKKQYIDHIHQHRILKQNNSIQNESFETEYDEQEEESGLETHEVTLEDESAATTTFANFP